ncbi:uncharacterized protein LOC144128713 [Amblyomma americanum]
MFKKKSRFSAADLIKLGRDEEEAMPLTRRGICNPASRAKKVPASQTAVAAQAGGQHSPPHGIRSDAHLSPALEEWPLSEDQQHWSSAWYTQASAVVVVLAVIALTAMTMALRDADIAEPEIGDAGRILSVNSSGAAGSNGTDARAQSHGLTALVGGADHYSRNENGSRAEDPEVTPNKSAFGDTGSGSNRSQISPHDLRVHSNLPHVQDTLSSFLRGRREERGWQKITRDLSRMKREELLESRDWRLVRLK